MWTEYFPSNKKIKKGRNIKCIQRRNTFLFYFFKSTFVVVVVLLSTSEIHDGKVPSFNFTFFSIALLIFSLFFHLRSWCWMLIFREENFRLNLLDFILDNFLPQHDLKFSIKRIFKVRAKHKEFSCMKSFSYIFFFNFLFLRKTVLLCFVRWEEK